MMEIYKITNLINGKIYVGQSRGKNKYYFGGGSILKRAIKKYGKQNFVKETIEECDSEDCLEEREKFWIKELDSRNPAIGYNIREGGGLNGGHYDMDGINNPNYGKKWSEELKQKLSEKLKGLSFEDKFGIEKALKIRKKLSDKHKGENNAMYGVKPDKKQCPICNKNIDIRNYNRWHGDKCRGVDYLTREDIKFLPKIKRRKKTEDEKKALSLKMKERVMTEEHLEKCRNNIKIAQLKYQSLKYECKYCGKECNKTNHFRWHDENCKLK